MQVTKGPEAPGELLQESGEITRQSLEPLAEI